MMLKPAEIIERSERGLTTDFLTYGVSLQGWTEEDAITIGLPVVIGDQNVGYVGVLMNKDENPPQVWWSPSTHEAFDLAEQDVIDEAVSRKKERR